MLLSSVEPFSLAMFIIFVQDCNGDMLSLFRTSSNSLIVTYSCTPSLVKTILFVFKSISTFSSNTNVFISAGSPPPKQAVISFHLSQFSASFLESLPVLTSQFTLVWSSVICFIYFPERHIYGYSRHERYLYQRHLYKFPTKQLPYP